jgi:hypothetical protein
MFEVREPGDSRWETAIEEATQDQPPCVLDADGRVVAIVLHGGEVTARQLAAVMNGVDGSESADNQIERAAVAMCELGQVEWDVQEDHRKEHFRQLARAAVGVFGLAAAITPEEARTLYAVWAGDAFDAQFLESAQPKLEAIAGESWR